MPYNSRVIQGQRPFNVQTRIGNNAVVLIVPDKLSIRTEFGQFENGTTDNEDLTAGGNG